MFSHIGADLSEDEIVSLGSDRRRLLVALAATTRVAPFVRSIPDAVPTYGIADVHQRLLASFTHEGDSFQKMVASFPGPGEVSVPSGEEWPRIPSNAFLIESFIRALWACLEYLKTRKWEEPTIACGAVLESLEMWAEYDIGRSWPPSAARTNPVGWDARKYTFEPVMAELGAQRLDLLLAGSDDPDVERLVLERAVRQGEWLEQRFAAWERQ